jgi:hypothetical protein
MSISEDKEGVMLVRFRGRSEYSARVSGCLVAMAVLLTARASPASLIYPDHLAQVLELDGKPPCTLCHTTETGQAGTATQRFAQTMKTLGLEGAGNAASLTKAIQADIYDTDGDLVADIQEIKDGSNPNVKDRTLEQPEPSTQDPGEEDPGEEDPGEEDPGEEDPGEEDPGEEAADGAAAASGEEPEQPRPSELGSAGGGSASSVPPSLPPPPPPLLGGGELPVRETGCAVSPQRVGARAAASAFLALAVFLGFRRRRR